ncbi:MAG: hypothetical protein RL754_594 [Bacteroidota bacterium]
MGWLGLALPSSDTTKVRHEFYVSVTDVYVDADKGMITGVVKTFPDDWERAMNALLQEKVMRYVELDSIDQFRLHADYLESHLQLTFNGESIRPKFHNTAHGPDELYLLFTADYGDRTLDELSGEWEVRQTLLSDVYTSQENIVIFHYDGQKKTNSCREGNGYLLSFDF